MAANGSHFAGEILTTYWYSPAARAIVKSVSRNPYLGTSTVELVDVAHGRHRHEPTKSGSNSIHRLLDRCTQLPLEEEPGPKCVGEELKAKEPEGSGCADAPVKPCLRHTSQAPSRHAQEYIQHRPNRTKQPRRWGPRRLRKLAVKGGGVRRGNDPETARDEASASQPASPSACRFKDGCAIERVSGAAVQPTDRARRTGPPAGTARCARHRGRST